MMIIILMSEKLLICIYTNKDKNEFAIGLKKDENFIVMTKADDFIHDLLMRLIN